MYCRKNYYLYKNSKEKMRERFGNVRIVATDDQWNVEINWRNQMRIPENGEIRLQFDKNEILIQNVEDMQREKTSVISREDVDSKMKWEHILKHCKKSAEQIDDWELYFVRYEELEFLPDEVKAIINNSFLIHGLMNYKYIVILFSTKEESTAVGIPGIYHQREKEVAEMFGFTKFICEKECETGSFGYYLRFL